jgi:hypothetical protein
LLGSNHQKRQHKQKAPTRKEQTQHHEQTDGAQRAPTQPEHDILLDAMMKHQRVMVI